MSTQPQPQPQPKPHLLQVGMAVILGLAVVGFFAGTDQAPAEHSPLVSGEDAEQERHGEVVPDYRALRRTPRGDPSGWTGEVAALSRAEVSEDKEVALAARASRRAYDGAPPTVPHPVRQSSAAECLACHAEGLMLRGRLASPMPHADLASCTQCHVVSEAPMPGEVLPPDAPTAAASLFVGLASPAGGERAWSIAPPTIPHKQHMREECMSCHGPGGRDAIQTSHPERHSCTQCHAPNATSDQRPAGPPGTP